jgi:hypothetical protein
MRRALPFLACALLLCTSLVQASPPMGLYAVIEKVVFEPNDSAPERVQVWGLFARALDGGTQYATPVYGYIYLHAERGEENVARTEWNDLKKLAGTGQCVAFASYYKQGFNRVRVRQPGTPPENSEAYPVSMGLIRLRATAFPAKEILNVAAAVSPAREAETAPGAVTLKARNIFASDHPKAKYVFEIQGPNREKEASPPVAAGEVFTEWTPTMKVKSGEHYSWRVWATDDNWKGQESTASFKGKFVR